MCKYAPRPLLMPLQQPWASERRLWPKSSVIFWVSRWIALLQNSWRRDHFETYHSVFWSNGANFVKKEFLRKQPQVPVCPCPRTRAHFSDVSVSITKWHISLVCICVTFTVAFSAAPSPFRSRGKLSDACGNINNSQFLASTKEGTCRKWLRRLLLAILRLYQAVQANPTCGMQCARVWTLLSVRVLRATLGYRLSSCSSWKIFRRQSDALEFVKRFNKQVKPELFVCWYTQRVSLVFVADTCALVSFCSGLRCGHLCQGSLLNFRSVPGFTRVLIREQRFLRATRATAVPGHDVWSVLALLQVLVLFSSFAILWVLWSDRLVYVDLPFCFTVNWGKISEITMK